MDSRTSAKKTQERKQRTRAARSSSARKLTGQAERLLPHGGVRRGRPLPHPGEAQLARVPPRLGLAYLGKLANFYKFLAGSFSAVSKRNFARKYAFDSIFQALQDSHPFAPLQSQNFRKKSV